MLQIVKNTGKFSAECVCVRCRNNYSVANKYDAKKSRIGDICKTCKTTISSIDNITQEILISVFNYDEDNGRLTHKHTTVSGNKGDIATICDNSNGYLKVTIGRKLMLAHRIIFVYMTGAFPKQVDHINHKRDDNRWSNLREVTARENQLNMSVSKNSTTGINGVAIHKPTGKYRAYIMVNRRQIHLGLFKEMDDAITARKDADIAYKFHKNHGVSR